MKDKCCRCGAYILHFYFELTIHTPKFGKDHQNSVLLWCMDCGRKEFGLDGKKRKTD